MNSRILAKPILALASILVAPLILAQSDDFPRTEFGQPDLQGTYTFRTLTPMNRPRELENFEVLTAEQAKEWEAFENRRQNRDLIIDSVGGAGYPPGVISYNNFWYERGVQTVADRRTSLIYDPPNGRQPARNAAGRERGAAYGQMVFESAGPEGRTTVDRCLVGFNAGPPMTPSAYNNNLQLIQTEDHIVIVNEMVHTARIIRLDSEHHTKQLKWEGDSVAHWEDDTLVVHTQNYYHDYNYSGSSDQAQITERFTRIDADTLNYDFTVEDSLTWDQTWSGKFPLRRAADPLYEYACHEGNHGLVGILAGWRRYESMGFNGDGSPKSDTGTVDTEEN
ncbi:MAG: hypothetical protein CMQ15_16820 [Gammaproteobacteria bacterium]|jgi:hypothetical protein|nr:hypothetical protein [Gammaproteobacteria bacterium]HJN94084.1 hypothetical protein [Gammaproteobacteria bacterium]|tara:strand:+ start:8254 stop:9264 length:1011 start_codon:yes stop_codon:yes gene_type:complete